MENNICKGCPLRLFNDKGYPIKGVGNITRGNVIVIPSIDKNAYKHQNLTFDEMVKELVEEFHSSTGGQLLEWCYITSLVKCVEHKNCPITEKIQDNCFELFIKEFTNIANRRILFLGKSTWNLFLDLNETRIDKGINHCNKYKIISWAWNYSPGVKYYNEEQYKQYQKVLRWWFQKLIA